MQLCPAGQSAVVLQAAWHLPQVHTRDWLQSLLSTHAPPTSIFFASLQPTKSHNEVIIKPGTRNRDADISILQFRHREKWAPESYHNGSFMVKSRVKDAAHDWGSTAAAGDKASLVPAELTPGNRGSPPRSCWPLICDCTSSTKPLYLKCNDGRHPRPLAIANRPSPGRRRRRTLRSSADRPAGAAA
jgi:hypothetical protein